MPKMAVIDLATGEVRGVIMASPDDPPYKGTRLVQLPEGKPHVGTRFTWSERDGFQPKQSYLDEMDAKVADPEWQRDYLLKEGVAEDDLATTTRSMTYEWDATNLTFVFKEVV